MRGKWFGQGADASDRVLPFAANEYVVVEDTLKIRQVLECPWLKTHFTLAVADWRDASIFSGEIGICRILNPWGRIRGRINLTMIAIPVVRFCE